MVLLKLYVSKNHILQLFVSLFGDILPFEFLFQMVDSMRGTPEGFSHGQASGSQQPPPPPPNLAEVKALQTELIRQLVQGQQNQPRSQQRGREDHIPQAAGYQEFFGTSPHCSIRRMSPWT